MVLWKYSIACRQKGNFPKSKDISSPDVVLCWQTWFQNQKDLWCPENFNPRISEMLFPRDTASRQSCITEATDGNMDIFHNPEPGDPNDERQYVTFNSGIHGKFSSQERQDLVRDLLLEEESTSSSLVGVVQNGLHLQIWIWRQDKYHGWNGETCKLQWQQLGCFYWGSAMPSSRSQEG